MSWVCCLGYMSICFHSKCPVLPVLVTCLVTCTLYWSHDTPHVFFRYLYWSDTNGVLKVPLATARNALCSLPTSSSYIVPNLTQPVFTVDLKANLLYYVDQNANVYAVPINSSTPSPTCVGNVGFTQVTLTTLGSNVMSSFDTSIIVCQYYLSLPLSPLMIQTMHSDLQPLQCKHTPAWLYLGKGGGGMGGGGGGKWGVATL